MENELLQKLLKLDALTLSKFKDYLNNHIVEICSAHGTNAKIIQEHSYGRMLCSNCKYYLYKNGHTKNGVQKCLCPTCKASFSETTGTITYHSKLPFETWKNVIDNLIDGLSIRRIAPKNNISIQTSFNLRHKIFNALQTFASNLTLSGDIQGYEKIFKINLKGTKPKNMPRYSKKASSGSVGIGSHLICILTLKTSMTIFLLN